MSFLPAARLEEGLVSGLNLTEHVILAEEAKGFFINWEKGRALAQQRIIEFNIRGTPANTVEVTVGRQPTAGFVGADEGASQFAAVGAPNPWVWISNPQFTFGAS